VQFFHVKEVLVNTPSSKALIKQEQKISSWRIFLLSSVTVILLILFWRIGDFKQDPFITETLSIQGEALSGSKLFKINCVGCHGISAQGFVGPDLHDATKVMSDKKIINQVIQGLTPPMPSFEIEPQSMADLLEYMHSLN
jgi:mono/diheme cytochrome c family protein